MNSIVLRGYIPNPSSARDAHFAFGSFFVKTKLVRGGDINIINWSRKPRFQVGGSCVANAWCHALEMLGDSLGIDVPKLSAQGLYWTARQRHGAETVDDGTWPRAAADALVKLGVGPDMDWPDNSQTLNKQPGPDYFVDASDRRIKLDAYYNILSTGEERLNEFEHAVISGHPVVMGIPVSQSFLDYRGGDTPLSPPDSSEIIGWHAVVVHGISGVGNGRRFMILNSWSERWGSLGHAWLTSDYIAQAIDIHVPVITVTKVSP